MGSSLVVIKIVKECDLILRMPWYILIKTSARRRDFELKI